MHLDTDVCSARATPLSGHMNYKSLHQIQSRAARGINVGTWEVEHRKCDPVVSVGVAEEKARVRAERRNWSHSACPPSPPHLKALKCPVCAAFKDGIPGLQVVKGHTLAGCISMIHEGWLGGTSVGCVREWMEASWVSSVR